MTFSEIADALGLDERSARRIVDGAIGKLRAGLGDEGPPELVVAALVLVLRERASDDCSTEKPSFSRPARRFSDNPINGNRAARAVAITPPSLSRSSEPQRARPLVPRRFPPKSPP